MEKDEIQKVTAQHRKEIIKKLDIADKPQAIEFLDWLAAQSVQKFLDQEDALFVLQMIFKRGEPNIWIEFNKRFQEELVKGYALRFVKYVIAEMRKTFSKKCSLHGGHKEKKKETKLH